MSEFSEEEVDAVAYLAAEFAGRHDAFDPKPRYPKSAALAKELFLDHARKVLETSGAVPREAFARLLEENRQLRVELDKQRRVDA